MPELARDPYEVLGVPRSADESDIKRAFRRLARELHPDVNGEDPAAEEKFKELNQAHEILKNPETRRLYDRHGADALRGYGARGGGPAAGAAGFDSISDLFNAFFGGGQPGGGGFDPFGGAATGPSGGRAPTATVGGDIAVGVELDLVDVMQGIRTEVSYEAVSRCDTCHGNGAKPGTPIVTCKRCDGIGHVRSVARTAFGQVVRTVVCDVCAGEGKVPEQPCETCEGRGSVPGKRVLSVDIPAGIADGQRIRLSGHGHAGEGGGPNGDLYVLVQVRDDPRFVRDGDDLVTMVEVSAPLASLGTTVDVPLLDGPIPLEVPAGTQPGEAIILKGRGLPSLRGGRRGDLRVMVSVTIPRRLDHEQRELLERLAETMTHDNLGEDDEDGGVFGKLRRAFGRQ